MAVYSSPVSSAFIRSESRLVAAIGLENIVLVETVDAVMAVSRERAQDLRLIIEDQNPARAHPTLALSADSGRLKWNTDPLPTWLMTPMVPPWASTIALQMASPMPVPCTP